MSVCVFMIVYVSVCVRRVYVCMSVCEYLYVWVFVSDCVYLCVLAQIKDT